MNQPTGKAQLKKQIIQIVKKRDEIELKSE